MKTKNIKITSVRSSVNVLVYYNIALNIQRLSYILYNYPLNLLYKLKQHMEVQSSGLNKFSRKFRRRTKEENRAWKKTVYNFFIKVQFDFFILKNKSS
jgi:hypothetical protein